jgi:putative membrane protein insertion efficiency factor
MDRFMSRFWQAVDFPFKVAAVFLITLYRYTLSAFTGRSCRHLPTCSEYTRDAIWTFGFWPGGWMGLARLWRCRPGGSHGYDPVPEALPEAGRWYLPWRFGTWRADDDGHDHA